MITLFSKRRLSRAFAERLEAGVVGDGADGDAQPGVHAWLDAFECVELAGELERGVGGLVAAAFGGGVIDRAQRAFERLAQVTDAIVDARGRWWRNPSRACDDAPRSWPASEESRRSIWAVFTGAGGPFDSRGGASR